jgi:ABC-2 type transport system ATP-binding protein
VSQVFLDVTAVNAGYGKKSVIHDISLSVGQGETYGLIGLNGAGKTTMLKTILGLKSPQQGAITVAGEIAGTLAAKRNLAYLPERFEPAWFLNAYEFIEFTLSLYKTRLDRAQIDAMAVKLGLDVSFLSKKAQSYSKGMRQKLGLMATFLTPCPLLILDEPMSGLDPRARAQVKDIMVEAKTQGRTIFLSSHILSDMEELCDRVAILHEGVIRFIGKPAALLEMTGERQLERAFLKNIENKHLGVA